MHRRGDAPRRDAPRRDVGRGPPPSLAEGLLPRCEPAFAGAPVLPVPLSQGFHIEAADQFAMPRRRELAQARGVDTRLHGPRIPRAKPTLELDCSALPSGHRLLGDDDSALPAHPREARHPLLTLEPVPGGSPIEHNTNRHSTRPDQASTVKLHINLLRVVLVQGRAPEVRPAAAGAPRTACSQQVSTSSIVEHAPMPGVSGSPIPPLPCVRPDIDRCGIQSRRGNGG